MPDLESTHQPTGAAVPEGRANSSGETVPTSPLESETAPNAAPMTSIQAEQILAELKGIRQNLLWVLLLGGFFAARAFFFHY